MSTNVHFEISTVSVYTRYRRMIFETSSELLRQISHESAFFFLSFLAFSRRPIVSLSEKRSSAPIRGDRWNDAGGTRGDVVEERIGRVARNIRKPN